MRIVRCKNSPACDYSGPAQDTLAHESSSCPERLLECVACSKSGIPAKALDHHCREECLFKAVRCGLGCGAWVSDALLSTHEAEACPKRMVACTYEADGCTEPLWAQDLDTHVSSQCKKRLVPCDLCNDDVRFDELENHRRARCRNRHVVCRVCKSGDIFAKDIDAHNRLFCSKRHVSCLACGSRDIPLDHLEVHEVSECVRRIVPCEAGCTATIHWNDMATHLHDECCRRFIPCARRCGVFVREEAMDEHLHLCPQRDVECGAEHRDCARPFDAWILKKQSGSKTIDSNFMPLVKCALHGNSALNFAVLNGDDELAAEVLRKATQVFGDDEVSMLYAMGAELSHENHAGQTLLTTACFNGYIALVKILVDFGADINGETSRGRTPLGDATLNGSTELVNYLISKRAVVNRVNRFKQTALNLVNRDAHPEVAAILDETSRLEFEQQQLFLAISTSRYDEISRILLGGVRDGYRSGMSFHLQEDFDAQHQAVVDCENLVQEVMVEVNELKRKAKNAKDQMAMLKNQIAEVDSKLASVQTRRPVCELG